MAELLAEHWKRCKELIQEGLNEDDASTWLTPLRLESIGPKRAVLSGIPNAFFKSRIKFQFAPLLKSCLARAFAHTSLDDDFELELRIAGPARQSGPVGSSAAASTTEAGDQESKAEGGRARQSRHVRHINLPDSRETPQQTPQQAFAEFVEAPSNSMALRAARDVALAPGREYNPLFISAGTGMGKTHLLRAIAGEAGRNFPEMRIVYQSAEVFTNDLVDGIRLKRTRSVRQRYRAVDMLLLDGVEFLQVAPRSQEELLHTFDEIHGRGGQLVFSADRLPGAMTAMHPGLRSRFQMGLVAEIDPADLEMRIRVLTSKATAQGIALSEEMVQLLAARITAGIRPLEGALVRLVAYASMYDEAITMEFVQRVAAPFFDRDPSQTGLPVSSDAVFARVCDQYEVTLKALRSRERTAHISRARRVTAYLLRELGSFSYPEIGTALGGRAHSTVIDAINRVKEELREDPHFRHAMMKVRYELSERAAETAS